MKWMLMLCLVYLQMIPAAVSDDLPTSCYRELDRISAKTAKELAKQHHISWIGEGLLYIAFDVDGDYCEYEARQLLLSCCEYYLNKIKSDKNLAKSCSGYSFSENDVSVALFFKKQRKYSSYEPFIATASIRHGLCKYAYRDPAERYRYSRKVEESYEQTLAKLQQSEFSAEAQLSRALYPVINKISRDLAKQGLELEGLGFDNQSVSLSFNLYKPIATQDARSLILLVAEMVLKEVNQAPALREHLAGHSLARDGLNISIYSFEGRRTGFSLRWPMAPNVEVVAIKNDLVTYGFMDQNYKRHRITEPRSETLKLNTSEDIQDSVREFAAKLDTATSSET